MAKILKYTFILILLGCCFVSCAVLSSDVFYQSSTEDWLPEKGSKWEYALSDRKPPQIISGSYVDSMFLFRNFINKDSIGIMVGIKNGDFSFMGLPFIPFIPSVSLFQKDKKTFRIMVEFSKYGMPIMSENILFYYRDTSPLYPDQIQKIRIDNSYYTILNSWDLSAENRNIELSPQYTYMFCFNLPCRKIKSFAIIFRNTPQLAPLSVKRRRAWAYDPLFIN